MILVNGLLAASLAAQIQYHVPDSVTTSGSCNVIPFGTTNTSATWRNQRYQQFVLPSDMGRGPCPSANGTATTPTTAKHNTNTFALEVPAQTSNITVLGFELLTATTAASPVSFQTRLHLASGSKPSTARARIGTMTVGKTVGWYKTMFTSPIPIAAGNKFYISWAPDTTIRFPFLSSGGTRVTHFFRSPTSTSWSGPFTSQRWCWRLVCASSGGSNNGHISSFLDRTSNTNTFAVEVPATTEARTVTGFSFFTRAPAGPMSLQIRLHLPAGAKPSVGIARTGTMAIGTVARWYRGNFSSPILIPANTKFFISYKPDTRMQFPHATSSAENAFGTYYWHSPTSTTWSGPFATSARWSYIVHTAGAGRISAIAFAACGSGNRHHDTMAVRMGYLRGTALTTNFNNNMSGGVTVLSARDYDWKSTKDRWENLHLQQSFNYDPSKGPLLIEVTATGSHFTASPNSYRTGSRPRLYATSWTSPPSTGSVGSSSALKVRVSFDTGYADVYGVGCKGSNSKIPALAFSGTPRVGGSLKISVSGGLPNANYYWVLGLKRPLTPFPLPGGGTCKAYPSLDIVLGGKLNASGAQTVIGTVPNNPGLNGLRVFTQFFPWDARANFFGTSATPYGRMLVGL
jgi:hypothetical protein